MLNITPYSELNITNHQIISALGYGLHTPMPEVLEKTDRLLKQIYGMVQPCYSFKIYPGVIKNNIVHIGKESFNTGNIITHALKGSIHFAVFITTAGILFQQWLEQLQLNNDIVDYYIANCIGSEIAEATTDWFQKKLEFEYQESHLSISNRYSPGYCGWDVTEQHKLFSLIRDNNSGVTLTESGLMYPIKSVSGIIGIGKEVKRKEYGCSQCNFAQCYKRKSVPYQ